MAKKIEFLVLSMNKPYRRFSEDICAAHSRNVSVVGAGALPRTEAVKRIWDYIKKNSLQNPSNKRNILADDKLRELFGKNEITMFELAGIVGKHLT